MKEFDPVEFYKEREKHTKELIRYLKQFDKDKYVNNQTHSQLSPSNNSTLPLLQDWSYLVSESLDIIARAKRNCLKIEVTKIKDNIFNCNFTLEQSVSKTLENQIMS